MDSPFKIVQNRHCSIDFEQCTTIRFMIIADPQLGLYDRYIRKTNPPYEWNYEIERINRAVEIIQKLKPKLNFVMICGDLVDAQPGCDQRSDQIKDLFNSFSSVETPLLVLPGNHDVGDKPKPKDIADYRNTWGDDYYTFTIRKIKFIVLNSQYFWNDSNCLNESNEFRKWLDNELFEKADQNRFNMIVVFQVSFDCLFFKKVLIVF